MRHPAARFDHLPLAAWSLVVAGLTGAVATLIWASDDFEWSGRLADMPIQELVRGSILCGFVFLALRWIIPATDIEDAVRPKALFLIFVVGAAWRIMLLWSTPVLEDDFYRYLWDGAVVSNGMNPYAFSPAQVAAGDAPAELQRLAAAAGGVFERINHPDVKTIYPPIAQLWFAVAHIADPWNLLPWRSVGFAAECGAFVLIVALLKHCGRAPVWVVLYWWNPVVLKELTNSAHLESVLLPIVLLALWLAVKQRYVAAAIGLAFAVGTKIWPLVLLPVVLRPALTEPRRLWAALAAFSLLVALWTVPPILGGVDGSSGFVQFARHWQNNSALYQGLLGAVQLSGSANQADIVVRVCLAALAGAAAIAISWPRSSSALATMQRAAVTVGVLFLLSPVQFPWYATWVLVLFPFVPALSLFVATITLPLYYLSFEFAAAGWREQYDQWVVWIVWLPIWLALVVDLRSFLAAGDARWRNA